MRQYVSEAPLEKGCLSVEGKKFRYMNSVLRVEEGDMMDVRLPGGILQPMTVAKVDRNGKKIILQAAGDECSESKGVHARAAENALFPYELWLIQFVAKPPKMDLIIRQAVVQRFFLWKANSARRGTLNLQEKKAAAATTGGSAL